MPDARCLPTGRLGGRLDALSRGRIRFGSWLFPIDIRNAPDPVPVRAGPRARGLAAGRGDGPRRVRRHASRRRRREAIGEPGPGGGHRPGPRPAPRQRRGAVGGRGRSPAARRRRGARGLAGGEVRMAGGVAGAGARGPGIAAQHLGLEPPPLPVRRARHARRGGGPTAPPRARRRRPRGRLQRRGGAAMVRAATYRARRPPAVRAAHGRLGPGRPGPRQVRDLARSLVAFSAT